VNELLTFGAVVSVHWTPEKNVGVVALAGITENEPDTGLVVVRLAVAEPGMSGAWVIQAPDEPAGSCVVENVPCEPGTTMFVTAAPWAPNANPNCCGAVDGIEMLSVYEVPFPVAAHVSPVAFPAARATADPRIAAHPSPTSAVAVQILMISLPPVEALIAVASTPPRQL
jgi:hypothetical protein